MAWYGEIKENMLNRNLKNTIEYQIKIIQAITTEQKNNKPKKQLYQKQTRLTSIASLSEHKNWNKLLTGNK